MNIAGWQKSVETVKKDQTSLSGFALRHEKAIESLGKKLTVTGGAIVASFGLLIKKTADAGDRINDLSQRTGIATEILSGYKLAADKSGASLEDFAVGMKGLANQMQAANVGNKQAQDLFKNLGVSITDDTGKLRPLNDVMLDVAERFSQMKDGQEKLSLATDVLGKSGMNLIPMFNMGRKGLEDNYEATKKLHGMWSGPAAKAADQFNDSIAEMKMSMGGLSKEIGMMFLPTVKNLVDGVTNIVSKFAEWAAEHPGIIASTGKMVFGISRVGCSNGTNLNRFTEASRGIPHSEIHGVRKQSHRPVQGLEPEYFQPVDGPGKASLDCRRRICRLADRTGDRRSHRARYGHSEHLLGKSSTSWVSIRDWTLNGWPGTRQRRRNVKKPLPWPPG